MYFSESIIDMYMSNSQKWQWYESCSKTLSCEDKLCVKTMPKGNFKYPTLGKYN